MVEGLLPPVHNSQLLTLLYRLAEWHALAKLRMHTEDTLNQLEATTTVIGKELRSFRASSATAWKCKELPSELAARGRKLAKKQAKAAAKASASSPSVAPILASHVPAGVPLHPVPTSQDPGPVPPHPVPAPPQDTQTPEAVPIPKVLAKVKLLNLFTYKLHALGDYVRTIRLFGTTDSYSTQIVCAMITYQMIRH